MTTTMLDPRAREEMKDQGANLELPALMPPISDLDEVIGLSVLANRIAWGDPEAAEALLRRLTVAIEGGDGSPADRWPPLRAAARALKTAMDGAAGLPHWAQLQERVQ